MDKTFENLKESLFEECYEAKLNTIYLLGAKKLTDEWKRACTISDLLMRIFKDCGLYEEFQMYEAKRDLKQ